MGEPKNIISGDILCLNKGILKKSWVKTYCLVWGKSQQSHPYMDFYESKEVYMQQKEKGKTCDRRVDLQHVKAVQYLCERDNTGNMEYSIEIKFNKGGKSQHFKFEDPTLAHNWHIKLSEAVDIPVLEQPASEGYESGDQEETNEGYDDEDEVVTVNVMYGGSGAGSQRFAVTVEDTDLAKLCGVVGEMTMLVSNCLLSFEDPKTKSLKYDFHVAWMRRFGKRRSDAFYFECGRKCPNGEGFINCKTKFAKEIHKLISKKSSSHSETVIPARPSVKPKPDIPLPQQHPQHQQHTTQTLPSNMGITGPTLPINMKRRHPGTVHGVPTLIPIAREDTTENNVPISPLRHSGGAGNSHFFLNSSGKPNDIVHELEDKLQKGQQAGIGSRKDDKKCEDQKSEKSKDEIKKEKKEQERREKQEKKEREEREKKEKEEKKAREKELKKQEKDKKKQMSKQRRESGNDQNDEVSCTSVDSLHDDAEQPSHARKSMQPYPPSDPFQIYDEPENHLGKRPSTKQNGVQYAEPYSTQGGVPVSCTAVYADVKKVVPDNTYSDVQKINSAWSQQGKGDEDIVHEEDYSNLKDAREALKNQPPGLPKRLYEEEDSEDDTYNTLGDNFGIQKQPENLYGMASARPVGPLVPSASGQSWSEPESGEEEEYEEDEGEYHTVNELGYEDPQTLRQSQKLPPKTVVVDESAYEMTEPEPVKKLSKPPPPGRKPTVRKTVALYEEVDQRF